MAIDNGTGGRQVWGAPSTTSLIPVAPMVFDKAVSGYRPQTVSTTSTSRFTPSGTLWGQLFAENPDRKVFYIQNVGTGGPIYVKYGPNAYSNSFNIILKADTAIDAGGGGSIREDSYRGVVSVSGTTNVTHRYIFWELS